MERQRNVTGRLSASNQYYLKKKRKKLGPIAKGLMVVAVLLMVGILIYEINAPTSPNSQPRKNITTPIANTPSEEEILNQQYQELLKRGQKFAETKRADSIQQAAQKILELEQKDNQAAQTVQRPPVKSGTNPVVIAKPKRQQTPVADNTSDARKNNKPVGSNSNASTGTPITTDNSQSSNNQPVEEVYYPAQSIGGTVTSASDGSGLSGVNVMVKGSSQSTVTDYKGTYSISLLAGPGPRVLQFNYRGNRVEREIRPGKNTINAKF